MIPLIDAHEILRDLNAWGWRDFKIELVCGFTRGYVAQVKCRNVVDMSHGRLVRLFNFWEEEALGRGVRVPAYGPALQIQTLVETSTAG